jgi:flagellar motor switch protein FliN/FliY
MADEKTLKTDAPHKPETRADAPLPGAVPPDFIADIPVTLKAVLGQVTLPVQALMNLKRGELLPLNKKIGEPIDILANGKVIARGDLIVLEEDPAVFCIQVVEIAGQKKQG